MNPTVQNSTDHRRFMRRAALPSLCLCLVAGLHVVRVVTAGQTPWKGGGFGMFSTVDAETSRFLRVWLETPVGDYPARIPPELEKRVAQLRAAPSRPAAEELARRLAERSWSRIGMRRRELATTAGAEIKSSDAAPLERAAEALSEPISKPDLSVNQVRVEVWKYTFEPTTYRLVAQPIIVAPSRERAQP